ncbi:alpha/beta hydrolase [Micromonospora sp. WMMD812]|uniref:alpha/beta fold hydrolase n=1 Tax=Micromonospora sp. WMMD812 TaxID=3015152 RepID=UPI00248AFEA7|nr:alpha/beta hydrolase [Micromonospora sp. WMMD812]WBB69651.1 alpha/beta hydrolase [Micromonospora sp. WMMD812]
MEFAELPGLRMAYRGWGPPEGRPVLLLPGGAADGGTWATVAARLADDGLRSYAPDPRGFGASGRPGRYGLTVSRDDVLAFCDALRLDWPVLVGHSSGAVVAALFAQAHPDRVAALVLEEPPPPVPLGLRLPPRPAGPFPYDWAAREAVVAELNAPDRAGWAGLDRITAPTLVVAGGPGSHLPQDELARVAERLPAGELVTIDAGHAVHASRPDEFVGAVRAFLRSRWVSGG